MRDFYVDRELGLEDDTVSAHETRKA